MIAGQQAEGVMQQLGLVPGFMQQPLVIVLGVLTAVGAAKSGQRFPVTTAFRVKEEFVRELIF
jgi:hypothetical protein